jgi:putative transposase
MRSWLSRQNKVRGKLRYIHRNPVKRGLVLEPQQWDWSSYRHYADGERAIVLVNEERKGAQVRKIAS